MSAEPEAGTKSVQPLLLAAIVFGLFLIWGNSFIAMSYLLGSEVSEPRFDWVSLSVARFLPAALIGATYCFVWRRRESIEIVKAHPIRLLVCGVLMVPAYNLAINYGQQHGVPAPIASVTTTLLPLFVLVLSRIFLRETITRRQLLGFAVSVAGMVVIATVRPGSDIARDGFARLLAITALAPASWAVYSIVSKPVISKVSPVLWTFLGISVGALPLALIAPFRGLPEMARLDLYGGAALLFLSLFCTVLGFVIWTWLLRHLNASTVGLTVFLNPPLTTLSKLALQMLLPASFLFTIGPGEIAGGIVVLLGLAIAMLTPGSRAQSPPAKL